MQVCSDKVTVATFLSVYPRAYDLLGKERHLMKRRTKGLGSLIKLKNPDGTDRSPFWQARFYDQMGNKISISTKTTVKQEAEAFLRKQMADVRDRGLAPLSDMRRIRYRDLRAGLLANYTERGNHKPSQGMDDGLCGLRPRT